MTLERAPQIPGGSLRERGRGLEARGLGLEARKAGEPFAAQVVDVLAAATTFTGNRKQPQ